MLDIQYDVHEFQVNKNVVSEPGIILITYNRRIYNYTCLSNFF